MPLTSSSSLSSLSSLSIDMMGDLINRSCCHHYAISDHQCHHNWVLYGSGLSWFEIKMIPCLSYCPGEAVKDRLNSCPEYQSYRCWMLREGIDLVRSFIITIRHEEEEKYQHKQQFDLKEKEKKQIWVISSSLIFGRVWLQSKYIWHHFCCLGSFRNWKLEMRKIGTNRFLHSSMSRLISIKMTKGDLWDKCLPVSGMVWLFDPRLWKLSRLTDTNLLDHIGQNFLLTKNLHKKCLPNI